MKIAQVAPLIESVPPPLYGGTERIVSHLVEGLVRQGHDITLFASGDSSTSATLVPCGEHALRHDPRVTDPIPHYMVMLDRVRRCAAEFDVIHFHIDVLHFPLFRDLAYRTVTTLHGRQDLPDLQRLYREFREMPLVSISDQQREPVPRMNWMGTVYHGFPIDLYRYNPVVRDDYLAFLGRICPEKRVDRAIEIARRTGMRLKIAAKIDRVDQTYFDEQIRPLLNDPLIEFVGEIDDAEKSAFLGDARALLFPIDWPEPFGLTMIEAMACGTPVVAYRCGSVPEVVEHGLTGFIVDTIDDAVCAVHRLDELNRGRVRDRFVERFSVERMANDYLAIYDALIRADKLPVQAA
jgi:glycosyltransferase involved in cell wall biosynthesis